MLSLKNNLLHNTEIERANEGNNCLEYIDTILYINLEHRKDRNEHCINEIKKIDPMLSRTHRIYAIYDNEIGARGCLASHIKALEHFVENIECQTALILEDDFTFTSNDNKYINELVSYLFNKVNDFDVILLSYGINDFNIENTSDNNIKKVISSQTASGYIVTRKYVNKLLNNFKQSYDNMKEFGYKPEWCSDQTWKQLMPNDNWYTYTNRIGVQYDNYSDIEKRIVSYNC